MGLSERITLFSLSRDRYFPSHLILTRSQPSMYLKPSRSPVLDACSLRPSSKVTCSGAAPPYQSGNHLSPTGPIRTVSESSFSFNGRIPSFFNRTSELSVSVLQALCASSEHSSPDSPGLSSKSPRRILVL